MVILLENQTKTIQVPKMNKGRVIPYSNINVKLYRIFSTQDITLCNGRVVPANTVGGFVASKDNIQHGWVENTAMVTGNAILKNGSVVSGTAIVAGNATIDKSIITDKSFVGDSAVVIDSIISGKAKIFDKSKVQNSVVTNSALVEGSAQVLDNSHLEGGSIVREQAKVIKCNISDTSEVRGQAQATNCVLKGRVIMEEGTFSNTTFNRDLELEVQAPERAYGE